jgi:hypothetical protein
LENSHKWELKEKEEIFESDSISIWKESRSQILRCQSGSDWCLSQQYYIYDNEIFKYDPTNWFSFEIIGNLHSFVLGLTINDLELVSHTLSIKKVYVHF